MYASPARAVEDTYSSVPGLALYKAEPQEGAEEDWLVGIAPNVVLFSGKMEAAFKGSLHLTRR
jgi:hypothetical protein